MPTTGRDAGRYINMEHHMRITTLLPILLLFATPAHAAPPVFCELYATGHFGNWYEVAGEREMRDMLREAKAWGYTRYSDWFDTLDCVDPFARDPQYSLANALWDRKRTNFKTAQDVGLETDLVICPNHVYRDQLKPEWLAKRGPRIQGQLICPSIPEAHKAILENNRRLFADLAKAGVHLTAINLAPYDYGGCACEKCRPWIITFAKLSLELHAIAREYHPQVELHFIGWWWSADEHKQFAAWMDEHAPGAARSISLHIPYGQTGVADVPLPKGCARYAFVHIGHPDAPAPRDFYALTGPVIAPHRMPATVQQLKAQGVTGVVAYSEGIYDDVNKALLGGLWTDQYKSSTDRYNSSDAILQAYAKRYFNADDAQARQWADWLTPWGQPFNVDAAAARKSLDALSGDPLALRRRQWQLKAEMFAAHRAIGAGNDWPPERLAHAEEFWAAWETLQRGVWGLGPARHILAAPFIGLPWYKSWAEHRNLAATQPTSAAG
jgi:hypothetical protein